MTARHRSGGAAELALVVGAMAAVLCVPPAGHRRGSPPAPEPLPIASGTTA